MRLSHKSNADSQLCGCIILVKGPYSYSAACVLAFNFSCKSIALFFQGFLNSLLANVHLFTNSQLTTLKFMPGLVSSPYYFLSSIYTMPPPPYHLSDKIFILQYIIFTPSQPLFPSFLSSIHI